MTIPLDHLLSDVAAAGDAGVSLSKLTKKYVGKVGAKARTPEVEFRDRLAVLLREGAIRGPFKNGAAQLYFAADKGPTVETVAAKVVQLVLHAGVKLLSKAALRGKLKGLDKAYLADALAQAVARRAILEVACGVSQYYIHRDVAAERFNFAAEPLSMGEAREPAWRVTFEDLRPVYNRLKAEQKGLPSVKIYDLMRALGAPIDELHRLIAQEAKMGRVLINPTTSVELPREVMDAALRLPGHSEPFVTIVIEDEL